MCISHVSTDAVDQDTLALFCRCVHNTWRCGGGYHSGLSRVQHPVHHRRVWDICGAGENLSELYIHLSSFGAAATFDIFMFSSEHCNVKINLQDCFSLLFLISNNDSFLNIPLKK